MCDNNAVRAVRALAEAIRVLRDSRIIRSGRHIGDLGEWYVRELYGGQLASSQTQMGWDVRASSVGGLIQVKTQTFDQGNKWNYLESDYSRFERLVQVILTSSFEIRALYDVPSGDLRGILRCGKDGKHYYYWDQLKPWRVDPTTLPGFSLLKELILTEAPHPS